MEIKIGVISDTHIPDKANQMPEVILRNFKGIDMIIHAGDLVELSVLDKLKEICPNVKAVRGNMDFQEAAKSLPEKQVFKVGKYTFGLMHGCGAASNLISLLTQSFNNDKPDVIIFGHSHIPFNAKIGDILFFNPGSPTDKVFAPYNSYGIIEVNDTIEARIIKI